MIIDKRKIVIVGTGMVGMSYAYSLLNQSLCDELVLKKLKSSCNTLQENYEGIFLSYAK